VDISASLVRRLLAAQFPRWAGLPLAPSAPGGPGSEFRGVPLAARDADVRAAVAALRGVLDPAPVLAVWQAAVAAPAWRGPGVWMHGDLHPADLLVDRARLSAVLDNCEHVIGAAAELCAGLLTAADDGRVLAASREPLRMTGEARYRLGPLAVPDPGDLAGVARAEAVVLFADRARNADARFVLDGQTSSVVARRAVRGRAVTVLG
jgi:Phosphotransferase enzyme family